MDSSIRDTLSKLVKTTKCFYGYYTNIREYFSYLENLPEEEQILEDVVQGFLVLNALVLVLLMSGVLVNGLTFTYLGYVIVLILRRHGQL